ncbi:AAA family ATPase [Camelimonas lactis]|uniref:DNA transposition AAA+ family ATPase n=1 Tax=Camelimonas lactis TaxID=659006 RepID=A0A4R2GRC2_9HYPH|nr:ATP-binding protein [Camelimonas lactis]TCO12409.1 DNA transposition AAA+ family ATPase [Camelimonas lactis]
MSETLMQHKGLEGGFGRPGSLAPLKNVAAMMKLVNRLMDRGAHMPGFGVMHGYSGYGKTYAAIFAQNKTRGPRVEVGDSWTKKTLVRAILRELGVREPRGTVADMTEQLICRLAEPDHPPLFIDEADKLVDKGMIELVREIQEGSQVPIILIGEEMLPQKLERIERVHNRVLDWATAQPCDTDDTAKLFRLFCPGLTVSADLLERIRRVSEGRARRIVSNCSRMAEYSRLSGVTDLNIDNYAGELFTGKSPSRKAVA